MPRYQLLPGLAPDERAALEESIADAGVLVPILVDERGAVIDGHHRKEIADRLGVKCPSIKCPPNLTDAEKRTMSLGLNVHRRHLTAAQREGLVANSLCSDPQLSDRMHAQRTGTSHPYVAKVRARLESEGLVETVSTRFDSSGREQPATKPPKDATEQGSPDEASTDAAGPAVTPSAPISGGGITGIADAEGEPDQAPPHGIERPDPVDLLAALETSVINAAADTRIRAAIAEFPFLADYPTEDVLSTADALRAIPEGPQRDRRIEAAKTWPAAVAAADDIKAAGVDPADELREVLTLVADASHALAGLSTPARDLITHMPPDEVDEWRQELKRAMSRLNALHIELNQPLALRRVK